MHADKARSVELAVKLLEEAAAKKTVPGPQLVKALSTLEKAQLPVNFAHPMCWTNLTLLECLLSQFSMRQCSAMLGNGCEH